MVKRKASNNRSKYKKFEHEVSSSNTYSILDESDIYVAMAILKSQGRVHVNATLEEVKDYLDTIKNK